MRRRKRIFLLKEENVFINESLTIEERVIKCVIGARVLLKQSTVVYSTVCFFNKEALIHKKELFKARFMLPDELELLTVYKNREERLNSAIEKSPN